MGELIKNKYTDAKTLLAIVEIDYKLALPFELTPGTWLAGGAPGDLLIGDKPRDYDVFGDSAESLNNLKDKCILDGWKEGFENEHVSVLEKEELILQLIFNPKGIFESPPFLLDTFPYTINQFSYSFDGGFIAAEKGFNDKLERIIRPHKPTPGRAVEFIERAIRYIKRGYTLDYTRFYPKVCELFSKASDEQIEDSLNSVILKKASCED
jgi:hypothetical protein